MAKKKRSDLAARGTRADAARDLFTATTGVEAKASEPAKASLAPGMNSARERLTSRIFLTVEIVLVVIPFVYLATAGVLNGGAASMESLRVMLQGHPAFLVMFIAACVQPFVAYLLRIAHRHYQQGDAGYTMGNLVALLCGEMLMQNMVGIVGVAVLMWRTWRRGSEQLGPWRERRGLGGVLADISGALVVFVLAAICAFASWRINA